MYMSGRLCVGQAIIDLSMDAIAEEWEPMSAPSGREAYEQYNGEMRAHLETIKELMQRHPDKNYIF